MKDVGTVNNRITATNGKFKVVRGAKDATFRYTQNIPGELRTNFSAGYTGGAIHRASNKFTNKP